jgi:hypothetical protein
MPSASWLIRRIETPNAQTRLQGLALRWLMNAAGLFMIASMM